MFFQAQTLKFRPKKQQKKPPGNTYEKNCCFGLKVLKRLSEWPPLGSLGGVEEWSGTSLWEGLAKTGDGIITPEKQIRKLFCTVRGPF